MSKENFVEENQLEDYAKHLAEGLDDLKSQRYYKILAREINCRRLEKALKLTIEAEKSGRLRTIKPPYFQRILRNWGFRTKFKKEKP